MSALSRRKFLFGLGGGSAAFWLNLRSNQTGSAFHSPQGDHHVYVARRGTFAENVAHVLEMAGGIQTFIDADDIVLLKPNGQWRYQGYTHTGCMKALIDIILQRPGGFSGEIIIIEHVQRNATDTMSTQYCWNMSPANRLNNWPDMNYLELVQDYHNQGRMNVSAVPLLNSGDGDFVRAQGPADLPEGKHGWVTTTCLITANNRTAYLPYALLRSPYSGKIIDLKNGVWQNGAYGSQQAKLIFLPTLNNHGSYNNEDYAGPTSAVKCHLGVVAFNGPSGTSNLHNIGYSNTASLNRPDAVGEAVGHLITSVIRPAFYMTCAEYTGHRGRTTPQAAHTKTIGLCADPVTLDYWMCKYVMLPVAPEQTFMNPDLNNNLRKTLEGCRSKGVGTLDESRMVVHTDDNSHTISGSVTSNGVGLQNVVMTGLPGNPTTNASGFYSALAPSGWSGTVTPTLAGYIFSPLNRTYADLASNQTDQNFTAALAAGLPAIGLSRGRLNFGAEIGGQRTNVQKVAISNIGEGTLDWMAMSGAAWLGVTPGSGTGGGVIEVSVNPAGLPAGTYRSLVTVTATGAANSPQTISVMLRVFAAGSTTASFGHFDTPTTGATVYGAIPVTGWALDDVEVMRVEIKRSPHPADPPAAIGPDGLVYVGDAIFVEGSRPDVEGIYPNHPLNYRSGWGYMMLTNTLPNQGNDTFTIHAFATDKEGKRVKLGEKTITGNNAGSALPFGTLDLPAQGGTTSGNDYLTAGWVLTPQPNIIPTDGSTIRVFVSGVLMGNPTYNLYRVDIATLFPGLQNSNGAIGVHNLDTTPLANGVHTIAWSVTDNAGNREGIGSRFFTVRNLGGGDAASASRTTAGGGGSGPRLSVSEIGNIPTALLEPVYAVRGYDPATHPEMVLAGEDGVVEIGIAEVERLQLTLGREAMERAVRSGRFSGRGALLLPEKPAPAGLGGALVTGYLVVGDELRALPIGSTLDPAAGTFSWQPGPGFLGEFTFVFVREGAGGRRDKTLVRITIAPKF